ncbi:MAG: helix-turn-helix domain-containing protein [Arenicella sp.]
MFSIESLYLAAIIHGGFLVTTLLFIRRGSRATNQMLALLVGLLTLSLWNLHTYQQGLPGYWRLIDFNDWYSIFFWGPALYFYVGMTTGLLQIKTLDLLRHFSLGITLFVIGTVLHIFSSKQWIPQFYISALNEVQLLAFYVQMGLYLFASFQLLNVYQRNIKDRFSSIDSMNLSWLRWLLTVFSMLIAVDMSITVPHVLRGDSSIPYLEIYVLAEAIAIFFIAYFSLIYSESIFQKRKSKYKSSPLSEQVSVDLAENLREIMKESQPYKNNDLKLSDLAQLLDINTHYLSQIINEQFDKNFYDFINEYRAKHAISILLEDGDNNITQIAYSVGFNNRASFNNAFKKQAGMTPSQYRRMHKSSPIKLQKGIN